MVSRPRVSTISHVGTVAKYNFVNYFRARRFYVMIAIVALVSGLISAVIAYRRPPDILASDLSLVGTTWSAFFSLMIVISVAFFGGDAIAGEFQNRTGYFTVPNPIRRSAMYVGKYLAALAASTIILLIYAGVTVLNVAYYFGVLPPTAFGESLVFAWVYLVAALALTFAFSSLFKSSAVSILMTVILLLLVFNIIDSLVATYIGIEPWYSITYGAGIVQNILAPVYPQPVTTMHFGEGRGFTITTYNAPVWEGLAILVGYFVVMGVLGLWLFEKKEFTS